MKSIPDIFLNNGSLAKFIQDYQYRSEQKEMAEAIIDVIQNGEDLICEAGTGTGKTLAYLVPALLSSKKTIVSTGTRHLQEQLKQKDLPTVLDALNLPITSIVLKGRANYLCLQRMESALRDSKNLGQQEMVDLQKVSIWSSSTRIGDINELSAIEEGSAIHRLITSTTENCMGQSCPQFENCYVFKNRKAAMDADLVITNHHLLLADLNLRESGFGEVLPLAEVIIFDEAHQLPALATAHFSQTMGSRQLLELVTDTRVADREEAGDIQDLNVILMKLEKQVRDVRCTFGQKDRRINWQEVEEKTSLSSKMPLMLEALQHVLQVLEEVGSRGKILENCYKRSRNLYNFIENYIEKNSEERIRWVDIRGHHFYLNQTPINIAETFQSRLNSHNASNIFISASLAVNKDFDHFRNQLGLNKCAARVWCSPFDYKTKTRLYLPKDLPDPGHADFFKAFIERTIILLSYSKGHTFVLFTSHHALRKAASILTDRMNYPIYIQGSGSRSELLNQFRKTKNAVLLGTSSFWEGVDVKGEALSSVIIDRLPFATPDDPVLQARLSYFSKQGRNPFMDYQVPQAAISLKQGVGRLIRDANDRGVCTVCDKRIIHKSYGKEFIKALPPMPVTHDLEDVKKFFAT